jgi:hypothetical protein
MSFFGRLSYTTRTSRLPFSSAFLGHPLPLPQVEDGGYFAVNLVKRVSRRRADGRLTVRLETGVVK